jgi:SAM-dependent methyltransferase
MSAADTARAAYQGQAGHQYHDGKRGLPSGSLPWVSRARAAVHQPFVKETDAVIELGCGAGWNIAAVRCRRRVGFDVATQLRTEIEAQGIEFVDSTAGLPAGGFQTVLCHHALEHVPDPLAMLSEARRLLDPAGRLLLAVPYEHEARSRRYDPAEPNHHLFSWNPQTLGNLVTVAGLRIEHLALRTYGYDRRAAQMAARFGLGEAGFGFLRRAMQAVRPLKEIALRARPS